MTNIKRSTAWLNGKFFANQKTSREALALLISIFKINAYLASGFLDYVMKMGCGNR
jgi:hypothetical protein